MRPLNLHTKATLLTSAITVAVLAAALALVSVRVADVVDKEQRDRAELQAINLAEQISHMPVPRDPQALAQAANLVRGERPDIVAVRVWERVGGVYKEAAAAAGSAPAEDIPEKTKEALRVGVDSKEVKALPQASGASFYRVFASIYEPPRFKGDANRFSGAVEIVERLDDAPLTARRLEPTAAWLALTAVFVITLATYLLFRQIVYRPLGRLLMVVSRAEAGDLRAEAPVRAADELGLLSRDFNRMIERIRRLTEERAARAGLLRERVQEATAELEHRNVQLEEINRELWETTRRLTELERLAAAGQTAAQFAHEVGTPLNLISNHVELLRAHLSDNPRAESRLDIIGAQIERISSIVRLMLDRTRPEAVTLVPLDLNALLLRTFDATAPVLERKCVRLETNLHEPLPLIEGDADRLQQVFINLINNALDAMPGGGVLRVQTGFALNATSQTFSTARDKSQSIKSAQVFVEFADTGCGMSTDVRARIFDPLYTTKERGRGTGLGLVVVRQVVREHNGEIEVESERGSGARFRLKFPALEIGASHGLASAASALPVTGL